MKKLIVCISLLLIISGIYSQETVPTQLLTKQDYLQKSKSQKTAAWILLGAGTAMIAIAAPGNVSFDILPVLAIGGGTAFIGSIPLFFAAGKNKRRAKAMTTYFHVQQTPMPTYVGLFKYALPCVSMRLNF